MCIITEKTNKCFYLRIKLRHSCRECDVCECRFEKAYATNVVLDLVAVSIGLRAYI
jgi:hypothetical protein